MLPPFILKKWEVNNEELQLKLLGIGTLYTKVDL